MMVLPKIYRERVVSAVTFVVANGFPAFPEVSARVNHGGVDTPVPLVFPNNVLKVICAARNTVSSTESCRERGDFGAHEAVRLVAGVLPGVRVQRVVADCAFAMVCAVGAQPAPVVSDLSPA